MKILKVSCYLFLYFAVSACSSVGVSTGQLNVSPGSNHYYANNFSHSEFSTYNKDSIKKAASSDQQLMLSLLNRPVSEDQRMMLAFAKRPAPYLPDSTIVGVEVKGEKQTDDTTARNRSVYANVIEQDANAVVISAMPK